MTVAATKTGSTEIVVADVSKYEIMTDRADEFLRVAAANMGEITDRDFTRIKLPVGGMTAFEIEGEIVSYFDGVIIWDSGHEAPRAYWSQSFGVGPANQPPQCYSSDGVTGIGNPGGDCKSCSHAQFGTKLRANGTPGKGQSCTLKRLVFICRETDVMPVVLAVPPSSLTAYRKYMTDLTMRLHQYKTSVVTRFGLVKAISDDGIAYSQLKCTAMGTLTPDMARALAERTAMILGSMKTAAASSASDAGMMRDD